MKKRKSVEQKRLSDSEARKADWKNWGPYVSDRAWGTVREDYSDEGEPWLYFPHDHARSRAFRWNEDGIGGFCNRMQNVCLAVGLWNGRDPIIKERFFGLNGHEGNHAEDVKEYYFYLDSTPTHSYAKMLYKYPQVAFPYDELVEVNGRLGKKDGEYELIDSLNDAFGQNRYFDIYIEYAKADEEDILCQITAINRADEPAPLHIMPHIWFRNTWSWGHSTEKPSLENQSTRHSSCIHANHKHLGDRWWYAQGVRGGQVDNETPELLFTENETNSAYLFGTENTSEFVKDGINNTIVHKAKGETNKAGKGTKAAAHIRTMIGAGDSYTVQVRFTKERLKTPFEDFDSILETRVDEANAFYHEVQNPELNEDEQRVQRQAFAGLMWSKQFYHYSLEKWLEGDKKGPKPPESRKEGRNNEWRHLYNLDVISMPDKWEYPWYAAWDLAFHMIPVAMIDPEWAKRQLILMTREWYMHPNGQLPAYEWAFGDVNPPVHAWAAWRIYKITEKQTGHADTIFLEKIFHKMLLNFTWWINRKDKSGNNIFQGGFLGLDNIGVFDRSSPLPSGGYLEQADGTAWMGMFCLNMLTIALELAKTKPAYEDVATKFFEHFVYIANAINAQYEENGLWHEENGFYYDALHTPNGEHIPLMIHSFVGLIPLFAVETIEPEVLERLPRFRQRMEWFIKHRSHLMKNLTLLNPHENEGRCLLSLVNETQLRRIMERMLDPEQFLSEYGLRGLSKEHEDNPFFINIDGNVHSVEYEPAESKTHLFGGNSNWRGPIWYPVNYLMIESLQKFDFYYGKDLKVEMPAGSGDYKCLWDVASELSQRLINVFLRDEATGKRPFYGDVDYFQNDPHWRDHVLFYEYFHGDNGRGIGASHQTGWTALVAKLIQQAGGISTRAETEEMEESAA
ncbi:MAG: glucosidase [Rhodothermales bacterium]